MNAKSNLTKSAVVLIVLAVFLLFLPRVAAAHCDTLDGPVITDAKAALEKGDVTPVLKWVRKEDEGEIHRAFEKAVTVRAKGPEARELADTYFFETLVRVHRAAEDAPFTGLKAAETELEPAVAGADKALETGKADELVKLVTSDVAAGIHHRFHHALEKKKHAAESVEAGRQYVEAYVEFVHYVERLHTDAIGPAARHHAEPESAAAEGGHQR